MSDETETTRSQIDQHNQAVYERAAVVQEFTDLRALFPCEQHLFERFVPQHTRILDLGVGGGRTTARLASGAALYVALDYSSAMVESCRASHPGRDVRLGDAADLSMFADASFDVVVFSYNGLDYLHPVERRRACIAEMARVIAPGGIVIVSSHHSRTLVRPLPDVDGVDGSRAKAFALQLYATARLLRVALPSRSLWNGKGYVRDSASANVMYATTPARMRRDFAAHGLELVESVGSRHPKRTPNIAEPWSYYAFRKRA